MHGIAPTHNCGVTTMTHHTAKHKLKPSSRGVASHLPTRTRLRVPKAYRKPGKLKKVDQALQSVPGVKRIDVNHETGSILIEHHPEPDFLERVTHALEESTPELLMAMLEPEMATPKLLSQVLGSLWREGHNGHNREHNGEDKSTEGDRKIAETAARTPLLKNYVPIAFIGLGIMQLVEEGSIIGSTPALALFYYAFDTYWKMQQENIASKMRDSLSKVQQADVPPEDKEKQA